MAIEIQNTALESNNTLNLAFCDSAELISLKKWHRQPYRLFYFAFTPRLKRKQRAFTANLAQKSQVAQDWRRFLTLYFDNKLDTFDVKPKQDLGTDKIIWQYWGQGFDDKLPPMVQLCFTSIDQYKGDYQVIRLCNQTIAEYLDLPEFVWEKRQNPEFKHAFFADLLRLALLKAYGGIWADATILLTAPIDNEIVKHDFFMFSRNATTDDKLFWQNFNSDYFGWSDNHYVNILNSFIVAKKESVILNHCLQIMLNFWHTQNHIPHYFFFQIMYDVLTKEFVQNQQLSIDDTLPHQLISIINDPFDADKYRQITENINIHKMTYIANVQPGSYYEYLLNIYK